MLNSMKIKISPCFMCGGKSSFRAEAPFAAFNGCQLHEQALLNHAQLLFQTTFMWYSRAGTAVKYTYDYATEEWES